MCAASGITVYSEPAMAPWIAADIAGGRPGSFSPASTRTGSLIVASSAVMLSPWIARPQPTKPATGVPLIMPPIHSITSGWAAR